MFYFYLFLILFLSFYLVLADKKDYFRFNRNIATSLIAAVLSLALYDKFLSQGSFDLVNQKLALEIFLKGNTESKEKVREDVEDLVTNLVAKEDAQAGELYILARRLRSISRAQRPSEVEGFFSLPRAIAASRDDNPRPVCCQKAFAEGELLWSTIRQEIPRKSFIFEEQSEYFR